MVGGFGMIPKILSDVLPEAHLIRVAVVGHTNTGKTSLLRTLTRDRGFGEVADAPGTTRQVSRSLCWLEGRPVLAWYDTPGLEDSMALRDWIEAYEPVAGQDRLEPYDRLARFVEDTQGKLRFEQEFRVIKQVLNSDAALYVIDVREPVLAKYRDELQLLAASGKPVVPVLNFLMSPGAEPQAWHQALSRLGIHVTLTFDTVSPPLEGEALVFNALGQVLRDAQPVLSALAQEAIASRIKRRDEALNRVAQLVVNVASAQWYGEPTEQATDGLTQVLQKSVRQAERDCTDQILRDYAFEADEYLPHALPWRSGRWDSDLFSVDAMKEMGLHLSKGAMTGAIAGAAVDLMTAGLTLGTGTVVGAATGTLWQSARRWGSDVVARVRGQQEMRVSDEILVLLATRQLQLIVALERRGHASKQPLQIDHLQTIAQLVQQNLPKHLGAARRHPQWSDLTAEPVMESSGRQVSQTAIDTVLKSVLFEFDALDEQEVAENS